MTRDSLLSTAARVEAATGPDRELDAEIAVAICPRLRRSGDQFHMPLGDRWVRVTIAEYTTSLDAALPGEDIVNVVRAGSVWTAVCLPGREVGIAPTEALARRAAALRAMAAAMGDV